MASFLDSIAAVVPAAKALSVIATLSVGAFMSGVGVILWFGDTAANVALVPGIVQTQVAFRTQLGVFQTRLDEGDLARLQILCLVRLTVSGEVPTPLEVQAYLANPAQCP